MGFKFVFYNMLSDDVLNRYNEAFAQSDLMSYTAIFNDRNGDEFKITPAVNTEQIYIYRNNDRFAYYIANGNTVYSHDGQIMGNLVDINGNWVYRNGKYIYTTNGLVSGTKVDSEGYKVDDDGNLIYVNGEKQYGGTPYIVPIGKPRYNGTAYLNSSGQLVNNNGHLVNENGRPVNDEGYLVDINNDRLIKRTTEYLDINGNVVNPVYLDNDGYWIKWNGNTYDYVYAIDKKEVASSGENHYWVAKNGTTRTDYKTMGANGEYYPNGRFVNENGYLIDEYGQEQLDGEGNPIFGGMPYSIERTLVGKEHIGAPYPEKAYLSAASISLDCQWDNKMGLLMDNQWDDTSPYSYGSCRIVTTSPSDFVYQVYKFAFRGRKKYWDSNGQEVNDKNDWVENMKYYNRGFQMLQNYGW